MMQGFCFWRMFLGIFFVPLRNFSINNNGRLKISKKLRDCGSYRRR